MGAVRRVASPGTVLAMVQMISETDVRSVLPAIRVPTLVIARSESPVPTRNGRYLADHIPSARFVEVAGGARLIWAGDQGGLDRRDPALPRACPPGKPDRAGDDLSTDIVGSTDLAASVGDARWRAILDEHNRIVREQLERFRGREVKTTGDGFMAVFDGPARAIRCHRPSASLSRPRASRFERGCTGEVELSRS